MELSGENSASFAGHFSRNHLSIPPCQMNYSPGGLGLDDLHDYDIIHPYACWANKTDAHSMDMIQSPCLSAPEMCIGAGVSLLRYSELGFKLDGKPSPHCSEPTVNTCHQVYEILSGKPLIQPDSDVRQRAVPVSK
jgi:hypothetical protein